MRRPKDSDPGSRVFIAGLRTFEIVYLPATGEITSWFDATGPFPEDMEDREVSPEGKDNLGRD